MCQRKHYYSEVVESGFQEVRREQILRGLTYKDLIFFFLICSQVAMKVSNSGGNKGGKEEGWILCM